MDKLAVCRICLANDIPMRFLNKCLQETYEVLTKLPFVTEDSRPTQVCYICCAKIYNSYKLAKACLLIEELFQEMLSTDALTAKKLEQLPCTKTFKIMRTVHLSYWGDSGDTRTVNLSYTGDCDDPHLNYLEDSNDNTEVQIVLNKQTVIDDVKVKPELIAESIASGCSAALSMSETSPNVLTPQDLAVTNEHVQEIESSDTDPGISRTIIEAASKNSDLNKNETDILSKTVTNEHVQEIESSDTDPAMSRTVIEVESESSDFNDSDTVILSEKSALSISETSPNESTNQDLAVTNEHVQEIESTDTDPAMSRTIIEAEPEDSDFDDNETVILSETAEEELSNEQHIEYDESSQWSSTEMHSLSEYTSSDDIPLKRLKIVLQRCDAVTNEHVQEIESAGTDPAMSHTVIIAGPENIDLNQNETDILSRAVQIELSEEQHIEYDESSQWSSTEMHPLSEYASSDDIPLKTLKIMLQTRDDTNQASKQVTQGEDNKKNELTKRKAIKRTQNLTSHEQPNEIDASPDDKRYECDLCNKHFNFKGNFITHIRKHRGDKRHKCNFCKKCFSRQSHLIVHNRKHSDEKPYKCNICFKSFSQKCYLFNHNRTHAGIKSYKCDVCNKCFSLKIGLVAHNNRIHSGDKPYECNICNKSFKQNASLRAHNRTHIDVERYKCDTCYKSFTIKSNLIRHNSIHSGDKPFKCNICFKSFTRNCYLVNHNRSHTGVKPFECSICYTSFITKSSLVTHHKRIHSSEKPYKCNICFKSFSQKCNLFNHNRTHAGIKSYKCDICNKCFTLKIGLVAHNNRIHSGEKPYKCNTCKKTFTGKSNLIRHNRIHTGDKPYKCDVCNKCFAIKSGLVAHHNRKHSGG